LSDLVEVLFIPERNWQEIVRHVTESLPEEGCGLLGGVTQGRVGRVELVLPVANQLHSPVRFRMDPAGQLRAFQTLEERGLELIVIFHSHPAGPETPSAMDLADFAYPGVLTLILSARPGSPGWKARAFHLGGSQPLYREVPVACGRDNA
jgi:proteasome lid subunit RPN8/RPN11